MYDSSLFVWDKQFAVICESSFDICFFPELIYRDKSVSEGRDAAHVAKQDPVFAAVDVGGDDGEVADEVNCVITPFNAGDRVTRRATVDEILGEGVAGHGAAAVEHEV